jgi:peptide/nickel transport system substrate-binding protein
MTTFSGLRVRRHLSTRSRRRWTGVVAVLVASAVLAACGTGGGSASGSSGSGSKSTPASSGTTPKLASGGTAVNGGTVTFALPPQSLANFIFPFVAPGYQTNQNLLNMEEMLYRPLYWYGVGNSPTLNTSMSLAYPPVYENGDTKVIVKLKPWKWSNGESVTAKDVMFWMNMLHAEKSNYALYVAGFFPDDVKTVTTKGTNEVIFNLKSKVNPAWFTGNELTGVTPMPIAWDKTSLSAAAGSGGCSAPAYGTADAKCAAVWSFLATQNGYDLKDPKAASGELAKYATNPLWKVVDGPWVLTEYQTSGYSVYKPNESYSGPNKPKVAAFVEEPFTTSTAEYNALVNGSVTVGYLPFSDVTDPAPSPGLAGTNDQSISSDYDLLPVYNWGFSSFGFNYNSSGDGGNAGKIFNQLYVRQAMQYLVDEPLYINKIFKNYAVPDYGPVPIFPKNQYASAGESDDPYPYNPAKAKALLSSHGWTIKPGGIDTCADAAKCGVPAGSALNFNFVYSAGNPTLTSLVDAEQSSWASLGIKVTPRTESEAVEVDSTSPCNPGPSCTWEMGDPQLPNWTYQPTYYPSGELLYYSKAAFASGYANPTVDTDILRTLSSSSPSAFATYQTAISSQVASIWEPTPAGSLAEVSTKIRGVTAGSLNYDFDPETWYFVKS